MTKSKKIETVTSQATSLVNIDLSLLGEYLKDKVTSQATKKIGRKHQVKSIIKRDKLTTTEKISKELGISRRNVSSILCYLKSEGFLFETGIFGNECRIFIL